jgi:hypothetical protein
MSRLAGENVYAVQCSRRNAAVLAQAPETSLEILPIFQSVETGCGEMYQNRVSWPSLLLEP